MTLRIDAALDGRVLTLRIVGRLEQASLPELELQVHHHRPRLVLDLDDVSLVDASAVRFLIACEADGVELRNCPAYVREWMDSEQKGR
jgi:anti-anti-sigma regulatory factor